MFFVRPRPMAGKNESAPVLVNNDPVHDGADQFFNGWRRSDRWRSQRYFLRPARRPQESKADGDIWHAQPMAEPAFRITAGLLEPFEAGEVFLATTPALPHSAAVYTGLD